ncbi:hypothetical protein ABZ630_27525, partial [Streptomyces albidoflavus]|uniref:hypothetical protein n=1 Tax=Streptomyces albidoflavus TaxID=1886 RepID=UPI003406CFE5
MSAGDDEGAGRGPADGGAHADGSGAPARTGVDHGATRTRSRAARAYDQEVFAGFDGEVEVVEDGGGVGAVG